MCEGCCGDVVHALHGIASILHGGMSEASFEERRGQLVHEVEVDGPLLVPGTSRDARRGHCPLDEVVECGVVGEAHRRQLWGAQPEGDDGSSALSLPTLAGRVLPLGACVCCGLAGGAVCVDGALQATGGFVRRWAPERRGAVVAKGVSLPPSAEPGT